MNISFDAIPIDSRENIYILGGGVSLDLFNRAKIDPAKDITITCNGAISYLPFAPDFQVCGDKHALDYWSKHKNAGCLWVARGNRIAQVSGLGLRFVNSAALFKGEYTGTGAHAFHLAYYINHYSTSIKNIYYIGFDFTDVKIPTAKTVTALPKAGAKTAERIKYSNNNKLFMYASSCEVMPYQLGIQVPKKWYKMQYTLQHSYNKCYQSQLKSLAALGKSTESFASKLRCLSLLDIKYLDSTRYQSGYMNAIRHGVKIIA